MRISDWSSDVCSSDLARRNSAWPASRGAMWRRSPPSWLPDRRQEARSTRGNKDDDRDQALRPAGTLRQRLAVGALPLQLRQLPRPRSEEHTSELQSLMRISYAVFCLQKKNKKSTIT